ncbi:MAG TPA: hypothetical protein VFO36_13910, partial [Nitrospiraceae bacterium]|nr:hypothetical protein [Nitrospiraceae bacterium]
ASKFFLIFGRDLNMQGWTSHALSMRQNISDWNCFIAKSSSGHRPSRMMKNVFQAALCDPRR